MTKSAGPAFVFTGSSGFGGSGHIMSLCMSTLVESGFRVHYVGDKVPFHLRGRAVWPRVVFETVTPLASSAMADEASAVASREQVFESRLADRIVSVVLGLARQDVEVIIWAHYIFPFGAAAVMAAAGARSQGVDVKVWLTPAGSDIWELAPQLPNSTRAIFDSDYVSRLCTYSPEFATEVGLWTGRRVEVLKPPVPPGFHPADEGERCKVRRELGVADDAFVISLHCNMRPIKDVPSVIDVVRRLAILLSPTPVELLLIGPEPSWPFDSHPSQVRLLGVRADTSKILPAADVALNLSRHDSFNLSLAEAMSVGLPVVSTDVVGIGWDIVQAGCGFLFPLDDPHMDSRYERVVRCLLGLAQDKTLRSEMRTKALYWSQTELSQSAFEERMKIFLVGSQDGL